MGRLHLVTRKPQWILGARQSQYASKGDRNIEVIPTNPTTAFADFESSSNFKSSLKCSTKFQKTLKPITELRISKEMSLSNGSGCIGQAIFDNLVVVANMLCGVWVLILRHFAVLQIVDYQACSACTCSRFLCFLNRTISIMHKFWKGRIKENRAEAIEAPRDNSGFEYFPGA